MSEAPKGLGARIVRGLRRRVSEQVEAARIQLGASYERIDAPALDRDLRAKLLGAQGALDPLLAAEAPEAVTRLIAGELRAFGASIRIGDPGFSWHRDFRSGHDYPRVPHPRVRVQQDRGHDVLVPWELSRLQVIPALVAAHRRTDDARLAAAFRRLVDSWCEANPYLVGVNWASEMEIAIRGLNLAVGLLWFGATRADARVLWGHAESVLARDFSPPKQGGNNHVLVSASGLLCTALCFHGARADALTARIQEVLEAEILRQFHADGGHFEASVHYHQLTLEASLVAALFLGARDRSLAPPVRERLGRAVDFASSYMAAFGQSPQLGDSSDARVLVFNGYYTADPLDHAFLGTLARSALPEDDTRFAEHVTAGFPDSGYGFHRAPGYGLCMAASPVGAPGHSGHHHLDKTSFVLRVGEQPVFVDSGTLCYTPDTRQRAALRATRAHNLVLLDGHEQADLPADLVFGRPARLRAWLRSPAPGRFEAGHDGYARFRGLGVVVRRVACSPGEIRITEELAGSGRRQVEIRFHLHPRVHATIEGRVVSVTADDRLLCHLELPEGFAPAFETAAYSAAYGEQEPCRVLILSRELELPGMVRYAIGVPGERT